MAGLINSFKIAEKLVNGRPLLLLQVARNMAGWNKDFKPAPYPKTEKERLEAAKKYNLQPEEYQPYPDDGLGYGDYPKLEAGLGIEAKDPYYPYDFPEHKRNFNEVLHTEIAMYGEDRYSQPARPRFTNAQYWGSFLGVMTLSFLIFFSLENMKTFRPVAVKQYSLDGSKHYTFETE